MEEVDSMSSTSTDPPHLTPEGIEAWTEQLGLADRAVITTQEASTVLRISERSVRQAIKEGALPSVRVGRRVLIPVPMLVNMLLGHEHIG
jgi:excisionase family DNA binding protein